MATANARSIGSWILRILLALISLMAGSHKLLAIR